MARRNRRLIFLLRFDELEVLEMPDFMKWQNTRIYDKCPSIHLVFEKEAEE